MIPTSASPNRTLLMLVGLVLLAIGGAVVAVAFGVRDAVPQAPQADSAVQDAAALPASPPLILLAVSVLVAAFAVVWFVAAVPRTRATSTLRLQRDGRGGVTELPTKVLQQAVEQRAEQVVGVVSASVRFAGTADHPDLIVRARVDERADLGDALGQLRGPLLADCEVALGAPLRSARVVLEPVRESRGSRAVDLA